MGGKGGWEEMAASIEDCEIVDKDWEGAMFAVMAEAEVIEPTFNEVTCQTDWPKWQVAIKVELTTLNMTGTWTVI
jgi:hypothetical protein